MIPESVDSIKKFVMWADKRWPGFYGWAMKHPGVTIEVKERVEAMIEVDTPGTDLFIERMLTLAASMVCTEVERMLL